MENYPAAYRNFREVAANVSALSSALEQDAYVRSADALFMQKNYSTARTMYQRVANLALPQSDYSLYQIALINGINNQAEKIRSFDQLVKQYPQSDLVPESYMQIANALMTQEKFRDAIPYLEKILAIKTATAYYPSVYLKLGLIYYNLNDNNNALKNYQHLVSTYPQSAEADEALENLKSIFVEQGKPNEYVDFVRQSGKNLTISEADSLTFASAQLQFNENNCSSAIQSFNNYLTKFPQGVYVLNALFNRSECYRKSNDWKNAVQGYAAVVEAGNNPFAERSSLTAARIYYLELQNYDSSKVYFTKLLSLSTSPGNQLEALRGLTRSYYQTKDFGQANEASKELLTKKGINTDDKAIANLVLGKSLQSSGNCAEAINAFKDVAKLNKSAWGAEARFEIANCLLMQDKLKDAEKAGMELIKTGGSDYWVAKGYILLGDIYLKEKDYFNAKATYKSVADNATNPDLKQEAAGKYEKALAENKQNQN